MADPDQNKCRCQSCDRAFSWKPELAGRKAKCPCGAVISFPIEPPNTVEPSASVHAGRGEDDPLAHLAAASSGQDVPDDQCPSCGGEISPSAVICVQCGFNRQSGRRAGQSISQAGPASHGGPKRKPIWIIAAAAATVILITVVVVIFLNPFGSSSSGSTFNQQRLVGKWTPSDTQGKTVYEFLPDGRVISNSSGTQFLAAYQGKGQYTLDGDTLNMTITVQQSNRTITFSSRHTIKSITHDQLTMTTSLVGFKDNDDPKDAVWLKVKSP